jgi:hypothetical protein
MTTPQTQPTKQAANNTKPAAPPPTTTAVTAPPETTALAEFDYGDDAGKGFENQDMTDRKIPIIQLLQSNSPQVVESKGKIYPGQFLNTVTGKVMDEVHFVPAITDTCFTQWVPRDDGGGFRGRHAKDAKVVLEAIKRNDGRAIGKLPVPQPKDPKTGKEQPTNELVESREIYCIVFDPKTDEIEGFAMIPFTSTKIKVYRDWNSQIGNFAPTINGKKVPMNKIPLFAHRVKMTGESETKNNFTYMIPVLSPSMGGDDLVKSLLLNNDPRYLAARQLHDDVMKGLAKAAYETMTQDPAADPEADAPF